MWNVEFQHTKVILFGIYFQCSSSMVIQHYLFQPKILGGLMDIVLSIVLSILFVCMTNEKRKILQGEMCEIFPGLQRLVYSALVNCRRQTNDCSLQVTRLKYFQIEYLFCRGHSSSVLWKLEEFQLFDIIKVQRKNRKNCNCSANQQHTIKEQLQTMHLTSLKRKFFLMANL